jgi:cyclopropane-fatty-acyl-phospholipid synthase
MTTVHSAELSWPTLRRPARTWTTPLRAAAAQLLFTSAMDRLDVSVQIGDKSYGRGGPQMIVNRPTEFFERLGADRAIGFGEAYMTGAWDAPELAEFLTVLAGSIRNLVPRPLHMLRSAVLPKPPGNERGAKDDTRRVIGHHYDLSNELFATFLDPTMTYSSAIFPVATDGSIGSGDLEAAQLTKIDRLLDLAGVGDGTRLLEIGSGWGALAIRAARRGAHVHTITLSSEQQVLARQRIAAHGLTDRIDVQLCDYRDVVGSYDAIVSVEMIEAVGWRHWKSYFASIDAALAPGGRAAIQAITMPHDRMQATRNTYTWMTKYIFPGGFLPSVQALKDAASAAGLRLTSSDAYGLHYAETLRQWNEKFVAHTTRIDELGFDHTFRRMWHFYLEYSRAGFACGYIDDHHLVFEKAAER